MCLAWHLWLAFEEELGFLNELPRDLSGHATRRRVVTPNQTSWSPNGPRELVEPHDDSQDQPRQEEPRGRPLVLPPSTVTQAARISSLTGAVGNRLGTAQVIVPMLTTTN